MGVANDTPSAVGGPLSSPVGYVSRRGDDGRHTRRCRYDAGARRRNGFLLLTMAHSQMIQMESVIYDRCRRIGFRWSWINGPWNPKCREICGQSDELYHSGTVRCVVWSDSRYKTVETANNGSLSQTLTRYVCSGSLLICRIYWKLHENLNL